MNPYIIGFVFGCLYFFCVFAVFHILDWPRQIQRETEEREANRDR